MLHYSILGPLASYSVFMQNGSSTVMLFFRLTRLLLAGRRHLCVHVLLLYYVILPSVRKICIMAIRECVTCIIDSLKETLSCEKSCTLYTLYYTLPMSIIGSYVHKHLHSVSAESSCHMSLASAAESQSSPCMDIHAWALSLMLFLGGNYRTDHVTHTDFLYGVCQLPSRIMYTH